MRTVLALAEKLGRTVTVVAMLALTSAAMLLAGSAADSPPGTTGTVPAASYGG